MNPRAAPGRFLLPALVALLVLATLAAPPVSGAAGWADGDAPVGDGAVEGATVAAAQADNETQRHRNPDEYSEGGDQEGLANWFERELGSRLGESAIELSEGEYDLASEYVDDSFEEQFSDYVDVAGDTGREERANAIDDARDAQQNLTENRRSFEETREEYEAAREAGNDERARALARELETLAGRINASSTSLTDHYGAIDESVETDLQSAIAAVETVNQEVQSTQAEIREQEFEETTLSITADSATISFSDPLTATGTLETTEGDPVGGETIRLDVGNQTLSVATDVDGSFAFTYRPISVPVSADAVSVSYLPDGSSVYLGSETSVPVSISQETPAISEPRTDAESIAFGDEFGIESAVTVDGEPVAGLPLLVRFGGESMGLLETDGDGTLAGSVTIPATVPDGDRELTVAIPFEDRAIAGTSASTTVTVTETTADLSVAASETDAELAVNGTFAADGAGIGGQSVAIAVDGETLTTATTGTEGRYDAVVEIPDAASGSVTVTASTDGEGTNLAAAEATDTVTVTGQASSGWSVFGVPLWIPGGFGLILVGALGWWFWRRRGAVDEEETTSPATTETGEEPTTVSTPQASTVLLTRAAEAVGAGRSEDAVSAAYGAVRRTFSTDDATDTRTHWEFYRECESETDDPDSLRALTEDYERATFDPDGVDGSTAERALSRAQALCDVGEAVDERGGAVSGDD